MHTYPPHGPVRPRMAGGSFGIDVKLQKLARLQDMVKRVEDANEMLKAKTKDPGTLGV